MAPDLRRNRVLVWLPRARDAEIAVRMLRRGGHQAETCRDVDSLAAAIQQGAGCAVLGEAALAPRARASLTAALQRQPPWSDLPLILFAGGRSPPQEADGLGNVTALDPPVRMRTLLSAVRAALRARARQYDAEHAIRLRDQFLAMLSHELRNPLGAIVLAVEMLNQIAGSTGSKHRAIIERQVRHLTRLVDDLLDVSRVTSGKVILTRALLDVDEVMRRSLQSIEGMVRAKSLDLKFRPARARVAVVADGVRLEQVFTNLLVNAVKYSPSGSRIQVSTATGAGDAVVRVADTGIGIAPEMLPRIFDLFAQAESSLDRSQGGMGIGLTLVKTLVEMHGGSVAAYSAGPGRGSEFVVRLPLAAGVDQAAIEPAPGGAPARPLRVVLVEDNADIREALKDLLEAIGCSVHVASDGSSGLAAILRQRPDVGLVDIGLPGMDGYAVAQNVRSSMGEDPFLVAVTGYGQHDDRQQALAAGFDEQITKPVTRPALEELLFRASARAPLARHP